jgi:hypothetical protein
MAAPLDRGRPTGWLTGKEFFGPAQQAGRGARASEGGSAVPLRRAIWQQQDQRRPAQRRAIAGVERDKGSSSTMRSNSKLVLAVLLGALLLSAFASASASASACTTHAGSGKFLLCANGSAVEETTTITAPTSLKSTFTLGLPAEWEGTIACTGASDTSAFRVHGLTASVTRTSRLELSGCVLQGNLARKCKVAATYLLQPTLGTFSSLESIIVAPESGTALFGFSFSNNGSETCPALYKGVHEVGGSYECKLHSPAVEAIEHELTCANAPGHKLKTAGEEDPLHLTQAISLGGTRAGQKFSIYEG